MLEKTAMANANDYVVPTLKSVYREVYEDKKARRM